MKSLKKMQKPNVDKDTVRRYMEDVRICKPKWYMVINGLLFLGVLSLFTALWILMFVRNI